MFLALDLSRASWLVAVHTPLADKIGRHKLAGDDSAGLLALSARLRARLERAAAGRSRSSAAPRRGTTASGCTACSRPTNVRNHLLDPASLQVDRRARRAKTDRIDAAACFAA